MKNLETQNTREVGVITLTESESKSKYQYLESSVYGGKVRINKGDLEKYYKGDLELAWKEENREKENK